MPAVTIDDANELPHISKPAATAIQRPVRSVTTAPRGLEGEGFPVRRAFAGVDMAELDPFVHLDQMGEVNYGPGEPKGTPWHPHRGFETVTLHDGRRHPARRLDRGRWSHPRWRHPVDDRRQGDPPHRDPAPRPRRHRGWFHGLQLWVNLPRAKKWIDPQYQDLEGTAVRLLSSTTAMACCVSSPER